MKNINLQNTEVTKMYETGLPVLNQSDGYRPAFSALGETNHQHEIEPWSTEDGWEILECVTCGAQW